MTSQEARQVVGGLSVVSTFSLIAFLTLLGLAGVASAQTWTPVANMNFVRDGHQATLLLDGRVLVSGGYDNSLLAIGPAELFDPTTGTWSVTGSNVSPQVDHSATLLQDGRVVVVGGTPGSAFCSSDNTAELFDPATGTWSATGSLPSAAGTGHVAVRLLDGRVLVAGGGNRCGGVFSTAALYDPVSGTWLATGSMATPRQFHSALLLSDGRVLVAGGAGGPFPCLASAEIYDPTTGVWTATGSMAIGRMTGGNESTQPFLAMLSDGRVLAAAGATGGDCFFSLAASAAAEVFDPSTDSWSSVAPMGAARFDTTLTTLSDGTVLVAGGFDGTSVLSSAELFDPATNTWSTTASLNTPRYVHTATLLAGGRVLLAGGADGSFARTATAEIFEIDATPPTITITTPADGASYTLGSTVYADYSCDDPGGSGVATCVGPVADGAPIDTGTVGSKSFTVNATDNAGNPASLTHGYAVRYAFTGFLAPIDNEPTVNKAKAGQTVPTQWRLTDANGVPISDAASFTSLSSGSMTCNTTDAADTIETYSGSSGLQYLGDGYWQFNWKTPKNYAGKCRVMMLNLADGTTHSALFQFT